LPDVARAVPGSVPGSAPGSVPGSASFAIVEVTTLQASFEEDLAAYSAAGAGGIGICELKLVEGREQEQLAAFRESGLRASACVPAVPSILPLPALPGPETAEERVLAIRAGMRRLAAFGPSAFVCLTGPAGALGEEAARSHVVEGLREVAEEGRRLGVPVGVEPMSAHFQDDWTLVTTLGEAAELVEEVGAEGLGITFDTWHLWDTPSLDEEISAHAQRIVCVHVADWREPTRGWCDRALPGEGAIDLGRILDALREAGWKGFYELELFSDDGTFGDDYEDSLWRLPAPELAERGREAFDSCVAPWSNRQARQEEESA
jgi:sugar phosphate isomerase/epimerase